MERNEIIRELEKLREGRLKQTAHALRVVLCQADGGWNQRLRQREVGDVILLKQEDKGAHFKIVCTRGFVHTGVFLM